ncbi:hypothetical protein [Paenibacillus abyssi]|uniref:Uncharacterized protein n=1 Tax=Paenibacillus abyssi TaxID=1340531 RepID=A0A917LEU6_9BACL|nr:hypothetical protein [Paenibacillus abyssi]GGG17569.1 hypothetical protein GCM10010916_38000 [Paenibacillus abyssi]
MNKSLFNPPSPKWRWFIYPLIGVFLYLNLRMILRIGSGSEITLGDKLVYSVQFSFMLASWYLLFGYRYLRWAANTKTELFWTAKQNRLIFIKKYGRLFINEEACKKLGIDPLPYKRLRQSDLREVAERIENQRVI